MNRKQPAPEELDHRPRKRRRTSNEQQQVVDNVHPPQNLDSLSHITHPSHHSTLGGAFDPFALNSASGYNDLSDIFGSLNQFQGSSIPDLSSFSGDLSFLSQQPSPTQSLQHTSSQQHQQGPQTVSSGQNVDDLLQIFNNGSSSISGNIPSELNFLLTSSSSPYNHSRSYLASPMPPAPVTTAPPTASSLINLHQQSQVPTSNTVGMIPQPQFNLNDVLSTPQSGISNLTPSTDPLIGSQNLGMFSSPQWGMGMSLGGLGMSLGGMGMSLGVGEMGGLNGGMNGHMSRMTSTSSPGVGIGMSDLGSLLGGSMGGGPMGAMTGLSHVNNTSLRSTSSSQMMHSDTPNGLSQPPQSIYSLSHSLSPPLAASSSYSIPTTSSVAPLTTASSSSKIAYADFPLATSVMLGRTPELGSAGLGLPIGSSGLNASTSNSLDVSALAASGSTTIGAPSLGSTNPSGLRGTPLGTASSLPTAGNLMGLNEMNGSTSWQQLQQKQQEEMNTRNSNLMRSNGLDLKEIPFKLPGVPSTSGLSVQNHVSPSNPVSYVPGTSAAFPRPSPTPLNHRSPSNPQTEQIRRTSMDLNSNKSPSGHSSSLKPPPNPPCINCYNKGINCYWLPGLAGGGCVACSAVGQACSRKDVVREGSVKSRISTPHGTTPPDHISPHPTRPQTSNHNSPSATIGPLSHPFDHLTSKPPTHSTLNSSTSSITSSTPNQLTNTTLESLALRILPSVSSSSPSAPVSSTRNDSIGMLTQNLRGPSSISQFLVPPASSTTSITTSNGVNLNPGSVNNRLANNTMGVSLSFHFVQESFKITPNNIFQLIWSNFVAAFDAVSADPARLCLHGEAIVAVLVARGATVSSHSSLVGPRFEKSPNLKGDLREYGKIRQQRSNNLLMKALQLVEDSTVVKSASMEGLIAILDLVHLLIWSCGDHLQAALRLLKVGLRQYQKLYEGGLPTSVQAKFAELIFVRDSQIAQRMNRLPIVKDSDLEWMFRDTPVQTKYHLTPDTVSSLDMAAPQGQILQVARFALDRAMAVSGVALKNLDAEVSENLLKMVDDKRVRLRKWLTFHHDALARRKKVGPVGLYRPDLTHSAKALFHLFWICEEQMFKHTTVGLEMMWKETKKQVAAEIHQLARALYHHLEEAQEVNSYATSFRIVAAFSFQLLPGAFKYLSRYLSDDDTGLDKKTRVEDVRMILEAVKPLGWFGITMGQWATDIEETLNKALADLDPMKMIPGELEGLINHHGPNRFGNQPRVSNPMTWDPQHLSTFTLTPSQNLKAPAIAAASVNSSISNSSPRDSLLSSVSRSNSSPKTEATPNVSSFEENPLDSAQRERMAQHLVEQILADISSASKYPDR